MPVTEESEISWSPEGKDSVEADGVKTFELSNIREGGTWLMNQSSESTCGIRSYQGSVARQVAANRWRGIMSARFQRQITELWLHRREVGVFLDVTNLGS